MMWSGLFTTFMMIWVFRLRSLTPTFFQRQLFYGGWALRSTYAEKQQRIKALVGKILEMKLAGADVATVSGYMKDVLRSHRGAYALPLLCGVINCYHRL
jgi:hypothetical protein